MRSLASVKVNEYLAQLALERAKGTASFKFLQNPYWQQQTWFIDPANVTGLASDTNSGVDATHPLLTYAELLTRWGTSAPVHTNGDLTITFLSSQPNPAADPVFCDVIMTAGNLILQGTITTPLFANETLSGVVARAAPNQRWNCIISAVTPGSTTIDLLVHDTTAGAWFMTYADAGGGAFEITEPNQLDSPFGPTLQPISDGDTVNVYRPVAVNVVSFNAVCIGSFAFSPPQMQYMTVTDGSTPGPFSGLVMLAGGLFSNTAIGCAFLNQLTATGGAFSAACATQRGLIVNSTSGALFYDCCGIDAHIDGFNFGTIYLDGYTLLDVGAFFIANGRFGLGLVNVRGNLTFPNASVEGYEAVDISVGGLDYNQASVQGNCTIGISCGSQLVYQGLAVATMPGVTQLKMDGATTASSFDGATWYGGINLTPANLDAAVGAAGFGGFAQGRLGSKMMRYQTP
jgi:hypothetical protein